MNMKEAIEKCTDMAKKENLLFITVAPPATGKTFFSNEMKKAGLEVIHSDTVRKELFGKDVIGFGDFKVLFGTIKAMASFSLTRGSVVYDACNLTKRARSMIKSIPAKKIAVVISAPKDQCIRQNRVDSIRDHVTPQWYMDECFSKIQVPEKSEGYDDVIFVENIF